MGIARRVKRAGNSQIRIRNKKLTKLIKACIFKSEVLMESRSK